MTTSVFCRGMAQFGILTTWPCSKTGNITSMAMIAFVLKPLNSEYQFHYSSKWPVYHVLTLYTINMASK
jgi:hypothetical protein